MGGFGASICRRSAAPRRGRARVRFRFLKDAEAAAKALHDTELDGRTLSAPGAAAPGARQAHPHRRAVRGDAGTHSRGATGARSAPTPTTRDGVVDALATWIGGLPDKRLSTETAGWRGHRAREVTSCPRASTGSPDSWAPHGRKRRATDLLLDRGHGGGERVHAGAVRGDARACARAGGAAPAAPEPTKEPTDPLALFMSRARARVDRVMGNEAPRYTKLPTPRKKLIELCAQQYGLRFQDRADGEHWVLVDGEQWLASQRQAVKPRSTAPRRRRREAFPISPRQAVRLSRLSRDARRRGGCARRSRRAP